jgi:hypothetical protein
MNELLISIATTIPMNLLLQQHELALKRYKATPNEATEDALGATALMVVLRTATKGNLNKAIEFIKELDQRKKINDLYNAQPMNSKPSN